MKLNKKLSENMLNEGIIASCPICNSLAVEIVKVVEDGICWKYSDENIVHKSKLKTDKDGDYTMFRVGSMWYNLNDFVRVNI